MYYEGAMEGQFKVWEDFLNKNEDFPYLMRKYTPEFFNEYNKGFDCYLEGNWKQALVHFNEAVVIT